MTTERELLDRIEALERQTRTQKWVTLTAAALLIAGGVAGSHRVDAQTSQNLRARSLTIEDEQGHDRIVIGSPVPDPREGRRSSPSTGMVINDANGYERFGLGLFQDNRVVMGFDAPVNTGDNRNRERITIVADDAGGAYVRFLDRRTLIAGRLRLDPENHLWMEFLDVGDKEIVTRRMGFSGDQTVREAR